MNFFRMNNDIFQYNLSPNEYTVLAYLYSCADKRTCTASVKQSTIAQNCGIRQVATVSRIISSLKEKGLIIASKRRLKRNLFLGTYKYTLKPINTHSFFCVPRFIIGKLAGTLMRMYLFVCKCVDKHRKMWNSYSDISRQLGIKRDSVISAIKELVTKGFVKKKSVLSKDGDYSDNHYEILNPCDKGSEKGKRKATQPITTPAEWQKSRVFVSRSCINYISKSWRCQAKMKKSLDFIYYFSGVVP